MRLSGQSVSDGVWSCRVPACRLIPNEADVEWLVSGGNHESLVH